MIKWSLIKHATQTEDNEELPDSARQRDARRSNRSVLSALANEAEAVASSDDLVFVVGADGVVKSVLDRSGSTGDHYPGELVGLPVSTIWPAAMSRALQDNIRRVLRTRQVRSVRLEHPERNKHYEFIFIAQGRERAMIVVRDVSDAQQRVSCLERLAYLDDLTGLPNLAWLLTELERVTERVPLTSGRAAVICIEIDQLDVAIKAASPDASNAILKELAKRVENGLRGANDESEMDDERYSAVARVDFQRFAVVLPIIETGEDAAAVAARLTELLESPVKIGATERRIKATAGIALYPQDGKNALELFDNAVIAMRDAKNSFSINQKFHSGTVRMRAFERQDLELELRRALDNGAFSLSYLPIVNRERRRAVMAEALLRWPKPVFGADSIREVVAVAEYTGMILPIGEWVFARACNQLVQWHDDGHDNLGLAVNVSAQEFSRVDLVERTQRVLGDTGLDAHRITLEITEHLLYRDAMRDFPVCRGLKDLGVSISVDDYGTGICSFEHLSRSPVDAVKIHMDFVARAAGNAAGRAACSAITAMAHELGISVVAEGVETEKQAAVLDEIGCDYLQGFLFCRPVAADELGKYLAAGAKR